LKALEASEGQLSKRDQATVADLERDIAQIRKAKAVLGDKAPQHTRPSDGRPPRRDGVLGKRDRSGGHVKDESNSSDTDEGVRDIPMPRDTPPPPPRKHFDRRHRPHEEPNDGQQGPATLPEKPASSSHQTVYESKPVVRDLRREAIGFVPSVVKRKLDTIKGVVPGKLVEEEELKQLEEQGYGHRAAKAVTKEESEDVHDLTLEDEMGRFDKDLRTVQVEDVEDEDG